MTRPQLTEPEKAYIAGIVDGEGYIGIWEHARKGRNPTIECNVVVDMMNEKVMRWLHSRIGGSFDIVRPYPPKRNCTSYRVTLWSREAASLLKDIQPYLIVKADKAGKLINIQEMRSSKHPIRMEEHALILEGRPTFSGGRN